MTNEGSLACRHHSASLGSMYDPMTGETFGHWHGCMDCGADLSDETRRAGQPAKAASSPKGDNAALGPEGVNRNEGTNG